MQTPRVPRQGACVYISIKAKKQRKLSTSHSSSSYARKSCWRCSNARMDIPIRQVIQCPIYRNSAGVPIRVGATSDRKRTSSGRSLVRHSEATTSVQLFSKSNVFDEIDCSDFNKLFSVLAEGTELSSCLLSRHVTSEPNQKNVCTCAP